MVNKQTKPNQIKQVELRVSEEEKEPLLDMLQCLYTDTPRASTVTDLLRVLFVADKVILRSLNTVDIQLSSIASFINPDVMLMRQYDVPSLMHCVSQKIAAKKLSVFECEEIIQFNESVQNSKSFELVVQDATQTIQGIYDDLNEVWKDEQFWQLSVQLRSVNIYIYIYTLFLFLDLFFNLLLFY